MTTQNTAPRSAPSAAAEYGLGHDLESDLPVIPALAEIDHIRVIDKSGASYRATPAQAANLLAPLLGMDYSLLTEQIVPGEYFVGRDGTRKQVYIRTFVTDSKVETTLYGTYARGFSMTGVETVLDAKGMILSEPPNGGVSTTRPIDRPAYYDILRTDITMFMPDFNAYEDGRMGCNILVVGPDKTQLTGHRFLMTVAVKYIKK